MLRLSLPGPEATDAFAQRLAAALLRVGEAPWALAFEGGLGAGKSHLIRALLRALGVQGAVPSPSYSLLELYPDAALSAAHMDWYRLADPLELEMLDWADMRATTALVLVEWAQRIPEQAADFDLRLSLKTEGQGRRLLLEPLSPKSMHLVTEIQKTP